MRRFFAPFLRRCGIMRGMGIIVILFFAAVPCALAVLAINHFRSSATPARRASAPPPKAQKPSRNQYSLAEGECAVAFRVGAKYYNAQAGHVMECVEIRGRRSRSAVFSWLWCAEAVRRSVADEPELNDWNRINIAEGVESCRRGALRADRLATDAEIARDVERNSGNHVDERQASAPKSHGSGCLGVALLIVAVAAALAAVA